MIARMLLVAALALTAGCGEDAKPPVQKLKDPVGYFGLQLCSCYLYKTDGSSDVLGVALERTVDRGKGLTTYELRYRNASGELFRTELVQPTSPDLLLWDVALAGGAPAWRLDQGLPLVRWPPEGRDGAPLTSSAKGSYRESATQTTAVPFQMDQRSDYGAATDVTFQRGAAPETARGERISYQLTSSDAAAPAWAMGPRTFVPEVGFVDLEQLDAGTGQRTWQLYAIKPLEGCPFPGGTTPQTQICGLTVY